MIKLEPITRCLDVGIDLCGDIQRHMVNEVAGISTILVQELQSENIDKFSEYWIKLKDGAYTQFLSDLKLTLSEMKSFNHIVAQSKSFNGSPEHKLLQSADIHGYKYILPYHDFVYIHLKSLDFAVHQAGEIKVFIIDLIENEVIFTETIKVFKGRSSYDLNKKIYSSDHQHLFVGIATDIKNGGATLKNVSCSEVADCCDCKEDCGCNNDFGILKKCNEVYKCENIDYIHDKYFCARLDVRCDFEKMICEYSEFFGRAYLFAVALRILNEKRLSTTRGWYQDANSEELRVDDIPRMKKEYKELILLAINDIQGIMQDSICWSCDGINVSRPTMGNY